MLLVKSKTVRTIWGGVSIVLYSSEELPSPAEGIT